MQFHEEIYTSAAKLLDNDSTGDLGVVARSQGFPRDVQRELEFSRSYHLLDGIPLSEPHKHPPRWICTLHGKERGFYCVSRVVFAGSDHTSRTTPLAHHLAFERNKLATTESPHNVLSRVSGAQDLFRDNWQRDPEWIEPLRDLNSFSNSRSSREFPSEETELLLSRERCFEILSITAELLLKFSVEKKSVVFLVDGQQAQFAIKLVADVLSLLPSSTEFDLTCVTHVVTPADLPPNSALIFSYPGTPFAKTSLERRDPHAPCVFDLTQPASIALPTMGGYAQTLCKMVSLEDYEEARKVPQLYEELQWNIGQINQFTDVFELIDRLSKVTASDQLTTIRQSLPTLTKDNGPLAHNSGFNNWCIRHLVEQKVMRELPEPDRWRALSELVGLEWPIDIRNNAFKKICTATTDRAAVPQLLAQFPNVEQHRKIWKAVQVYAHTRPHLLANFIEDSINEGSASRHAAEGLIRIDTWDPEQIEASIKSTLVKHKTLQSFVTDALVYYFDNLVGRQVDITVADHANAIESSKNLLQLLANHDTGNLLDSLVRYHLVLSLKARVFEEQVSWLKVRFPELLEKDRLTISLAKCGKLESQLRNDLEALGLLPIITGSGQNLKEPPFALNLPVEPPTLEPRVVINTPRRRPRSISIEEESDHGPLKWLIYLCGIMFLLVSVRLPVAAWQHWLPIGWIYWKQLAEILETLIITCGLACLCYLAAWCLANIPMLVEKLRGQKLTPVAWKTSWLVALVASALCWSLFCTLLLARVNMSHLASWLQLLIIVSLMWTIPFMVDYSLRGAPPDRLRAAERPKIFAAVALTLMLISSILLYVIMHYQLLVRNS